LNPVNSLKVLRLDNNEKLETLVPGTLRNLRELRMLTMQVKNKAIQCLED